METVVIDLYDSGILICNKDRILVKSASYALIESDNSITVGGPAEQQAYLRPREISTHFWGQLSGNSDTKYVVSNAQLAFEHLQFAWKQVAKPNLEVIIAVPNTLNKQDLGLLLGVCEKLFIPVIGLVSKAVLALQGPAPNCKVVYLDVLQQETVITEVLQQETTVSALQVNTILAYGLQSSANSLAKFISTKFINETRFDPTYTAEDEQKFFNKLPIWLKKLEESDSIECKLGPNTSSYCIQLQKKHLLDISRTAFGEITEYLRSTFHDQDTAAIICSPSCVEIFGFLESLKALPGCAVVSLEHVNIARQALLYKEQIKPKSNQIHYTTSLIWGKDVKPKALEFNSEPLSSLNKTPTHLLVNNHAHPLLQEIFVANSNSGGHALAINNTLDNNSACRIFADGLLFRAKSLNNHKIKVNNVVLETNQSVHIGDHLCIEGVEKDMFFIKVN